MKSMLIVLKNDSSKTIRGYSWYKLEQGFMVFSFPETEEKNYVTAEGCALSEIASYTEFNSQCLN